LPIAQRSRELVVEPSDCSGLPRHRADHQHGGRARGAEGARRRPNPAIGRLPVAKLARPRSHPASRRTDIMLLRQASRCRRPRPDRFPVPTPTSAAATPLHWRKDPGRAGVEARAGGAERAAAGTSPGPSVRHRWGTGRQPCTEKRRMTGALCARAALHMAPARNRSWAWLPVAAGIP